MLSFHTASGSVVKTVQCEACHRQYVYTLSREAHGASSSFLVPDYQAAEQNASDKPERLLENECDPVPCPTCGWYQRDMVKRIQQLRYRWLAIVARGLFFISFVLALPVGIATIREFDLVLFLLWGGLLATAVVCLALNSLLARRFDPNEPDIAQSAEFEKLMEKIKRENEERELRKQMGR